MKANTLWKAVRSVVSLLFVLTLVITCVQTGEISAFSAGHKHSWIPATFTQPQTCSICGATEGKPAPESTFPTQEEIKYMIQNSGYPTVSDKRVNLKLPNNNDYLSNPYRARVKSEGGRRIYVMPIPQAGNGNLGTINDGTEVVIMARRGGFAFFVSYDGQMGWNGDGYFAAISNSSSSAAKPTGGSGLTGYSYRDLVNRVVSYDRFVEIPEDYEVLDQPVIRYVHGSNPNSAAGGMYLRRSPSGTNNSIRVLRPHTEVIVLAVRGSLKTSSGYAFVETPDKEYGWVAFQAARDIGLSETNDF